MPQLKAKEITSQEALKIIPDLVDTYRSEGMIRRLFEDIKYNGTFTYQGKRYHIDDPHPFQEEGPPTPMAMPGQLSLT